MPAPILRIADRPERPGARSSRRRAGPDGGIAVAVAAASRARSRTRPVDPSAYLEPLRRSGVRALTLADADYPARLRRIELPPPVLYLAGAAAALDRTRAVAIVGTRRPTAIGRATSGRIADAIAGLGATVVSGLAARHRRGRARRRAARRRDHRGGHRRRPRAPVSGGPSRAGPGDRRAAAARSSASSRPRRRPAAGTFPRRNRIISGLADATVVVEAGARSGALTTAAWALEQGRGLHIVPGPARRPGGRRAASRSCARPGPRRASSRASPS